MKNQKEIVEKVIDYIEKNLEKEINLDTISKNIGYSKFYLNRIFTGNYSVPCLGHIDFWSKQRK